ncbi:MAG: flagellar hook-basal body protein [Bacteriovoracaceae bacterium]|nr:flagellar hook-basal body protein [Bacteriovoracaceae bacterium]
MKELWVPLSGAMAQQRKVETIANNVANANTTAFKKDRAVFKEHLTAHEKGIDVDLPSKEFAPEDFYRTYGAENAHVVVDGTYTNFAQGPIRPTRNPFDLALEGKGFLEVLGPNGIRYTRKGNLTVNQEGEIVNDLGMKILSRVDLPEVGDGNEVVDVIKQIPAPNERVIKIQKGPITINNQGEIFQNGNLIAQLNLVEFRDPSVLKKEGNSLYINEDSRNVKKSQRESIVHQGALELSNVNTVEEMSNLIKAHRQLETIQRAIKSYDNMANKAYNEIARF